MKVKLGDACEILNGFSFKSENYVSSGIRIIRIANVQKGYIYDSAPCYYPVELQSELEKFILREGDLLMSLTGNVGRVALLQKEMLPAALNQRVACLRTKTDKLLIKYLFHLLNGDKFEQACINSSKGIAQKNMSTEWLKEYVFDLPSIEEQKKYISVFDKLDEVIEKRNQQLENLDLLIKSKFREMFGDILVNDKGWNCIALGDACEISSSKRIYEAEYVNDGVPFYRSKEIVELGNGERPSVELFISYDRYNEIKSRYGIPNVGDILITAVGTIGKMWIVDSKEPFYYKDGNIISIRPKLFNSIFLKFAVEILIKLFKENNVSGSAYGALTIINFKTMSVCLPPIEPQEQFAGFVEKVESNKNIITKSLEKLEALKKALMQKYFG